MLAQILQHLPRCSAAEASAFAGFLVGDHRHGAIDADREDLIHALEVAIGAVVQHERPITADASHDRLAGLRMHPDLAR